MAFVTLATFKDSTVVCEADITTTTIRSLRVTNNGARTVVGQAANKSLGLSFRGEFPPGSVTTRNIPTALRNKIQFVNTTDSETGEPIRTLPGWQIQWSYAVNPAEVTNL